MFALPELLYQECDVQVPVVEQMSKQVVQIYTLHQVQHTQAVQLSRMPSRAHSTAGVRLLH